MAALITFETYGSCVGMFPRKEVGIQVLAGLAPFSQTVGPKQYFLRYLRMSPIS
jgi:hypothetical protein